MSVACKLPFTHVISRGNYRKDLFDRGAAASFEKALFEACGKCDWRLHAYVIMGNHYHLALETPEPNLVDGMRWLQGTFGNRFNAFRKERGHVFQSRYQSLVVEEGRPLLGLVNYIHLNPVRAGMVELESLHEYQWSSYPKFFRNKTPAPLHRQRFLASLEFPDSTKGMRQYARHLELAEESEPAARDVLASRYCRGWAIASQEYRKVLKTFYAEKEELPGCGGPEVGELREEKWARALEAAMLKAGKTVAAAGSDQKAAPWKVRIAREMRATTTASNAWIAEHLNMGLPTRVCNLIRGKCKLWD